MLCIPFSANMSNQSVTGSLGESESFLSMLTCLIIDFPTNTTSNGIDCSTKNPSVCVKCHTISSFTTGEAISDTGGTGHLIAILIWLIVCVIGIFGSVTNIIIILVLKKRVNKGKQFDFLVTFLAVFDLFACIGATLAATSIIASYQEWGIGGNVVPTYFLHLSVSAALFAHSLSTHLMVIINIHCYIGIAYPLSSRKWFSWKWIRLVPLITLLVTIILNMPRVGMILVDKNIYNEDGYDIPILRGFDYISMRRIKWWRFWYMTMFTLFDQLDVTLPLILLVIFNLLSYLKVNELQKTRKELSSTQEKQMQPVKMFLPVVTFLLCCNVGPIIVYLVGHIKGVIYRELVITLCLSVALNSSVNFVIYYFRGNTFRKDTNKMFLRLVDNQRSESVSSEMSGISK